LDAESLRGAWQLGEPDGRGKQYRKAIIVNGYGK